ncbi:MAG TPA: exosortase A [Gammaproteobacteria bacterium]|nr:exosortase A [Gammaproteobacteria bacterium]
MPPSSPHTASLPSPWPRSAVAVALLVAAVLGVYWETVYSTAAIWMRSETFTHGFFVAPISLYLIWRKRAALAALTPRPAWWGLVLLPGLGLVWLLGHYASVLVVQQLAVVAMIPAAVFTVLGWAVTRTIAFPLGFLLFAVPMGEELIPHLVDFTADFAVTALQFTGVPVYREGTFFEIPSGSWSVVEACSGIRYLIASMTLGFLFAYLNYQSYWRRALFIAAAVIVPIFANGARAYMIVMIAHLSDNKLAHGVDHFLYGWVFFGLVMLILFWVGSFWSEDEAAPAAVAARGRAPAPAPVPAFRLALTAALAFVAVVAWPVAAAMSDQARSQIRPVVLAPPQGADGWRAVPEPLANWWPAYFGVDAALQQKYLKDGQAVSVYLGYYRSQRQDAELVTSQNVLVMERDRQWKRIAHRSRGLSLGGQSWTVRTARLKSEDGNLLVWYWYWLDGRYTTNRYLAKLWDAKTKLLGQPNDSAVVMLITPYDEKTEQAQARLQHFAEAMVPSIEAALQAAARE